MMNEKEIIDSIKSELEDVDNIVYEGPKIIIYTKNEEIFKKGFELGKNLAQKYKKRIEIRISPKKLMKDEEIINVTKEILEKYNIRYKNIFVERHRSILIIESYEPEKISQELINIIREKTLCNVKIERAPLKSSKIIDGIRSYLHKFSKYRSEFLNSVGERILNRKYEKRYGLYRITFLGGGREVGRSCILLKTEESNVLLDVGLAASTYGSDSYPYLYLPEFDISKLDAVVITHAHLDHIGFLPYLFKLGWKGPVYLTEPTRDIGGLITLDYVKVSRSNLKTEIYSYVDVKNFLKHTIPLNYEEVTDITPDIKITLYNAGHIIGSAMVHINIENKHNILYTGDLKYAPGRLLNKPNTKFQRLETLIIESTYGGNNDFHPPREESEKELINDIKETINNGGKVLIPVLAVGRAQDIILLISEAIRNGEIPKVNIYLEGILWETSMIHTAYPEFLSGEIKRLIYEGKNPFEQEFIIRVSKKERDQIIEEKEPSIIIATSGMLQGGPVVEYFKRLANNEKNLLAFVSYQAKGTLGRRILDGEKEFNIDGEKVEVKLRYKKYDGFSGHADRRELLAFINKLNPKPKQIFLVHGELPKPIELSTAIQKRFGILTYVPNNGDVITL